MERNSSGMSRGSRRREWFGSTLSERYEILEVRIDAGKQCLTTQAPICEFYCFCLIESVLVPLLS